MMLRNAPHRALPALRRPSLAPSSSSAPDAADQPTARTDIKLRPYQVDCIRAVLDELERGEFSRLGVSAPTGSGKTAIFTSLISHLPPLVHPVTGETATRVLIIVNSIQLATQTAGAVKRAYPHLIVEIEQGKSLASGLADVTVCTYQTLARSSFSRLEKFIPEHYKAVIVDEAHHAAAPSYLEILARFDSHVEEALGAAGGGAGLVEANEIAPAPPAPVEEGEEVVTGEGVADETGDFLPSAADDPSSAADTISDSLLPIAAPIPAKVDSLGRMRVPLLAFTATWGRADGLALGKVFEKIVWHGEWLSMIKGRWLSQLEFTTVHLGSALDLATIDVSSATGEFSTASLARAVDKREVNDLAVDAWFENAGDRRSTLVFAVNIPHVISLTNTFRERGIDARFVYEKTKQKDREEIYRAFKAGEFPVLVNCGILTEGADFPAIDCVLLARPTRSQNLFLQMLGRGLRLSPDTGKENCLVIDLIGQSADFGVVCTPTLFGIDPATVIEGRSTQQLEELATEQLRSNPAPAPSAPDPSSALSRRHSVSYRHYTAFDLVAQIAADGTEEHIPVSRLSRLAWVGCGEVWILQLMGLGYAKIMRDGEEFHSLLYLRLPFWMHSSSSSSGPRFATPVPLASHSSFPILIRTTDAALLNHPELADIGASLTRFAPWRRAPASASQRAFILKKVLSTEERAQGVQDIEGVWVGRPWKERVRVDEALSKGTASDIISRVSHGGIAFWRKERRALVREEKRAEREGEKLEKRLEKARARRRAAAE
ncbi:Putative ATP-dependent helicase IRC3 [Rhodotorula kratochvilovae]